MDKKYYVSRKSTESTMMDKKTQKLAANSLYAIWSAKHLSIQCHHQVAVTPRPPGAISPTAEFILYDWHQGLLRDSTLSWTSKRGLFKVVEIKSDSVPTCASSAQGWPTSPRSTCMFRTRRVLDSPPSRSTFLCLVHGVDNHGNEARRKSCHPSMPAESWP